MSVKTTSLLLMAFVIVNTAGCGSDAAAPVPQIASGAPTLYAGCGQGKKLCPVDVDHDHFTYSGAPTECVPVATTCPAPGDCDDTNASIHLGAVEICGDGIDQNCLAGDLSCDDVDDDGDGLTENQGDCNDTNAAIHPGAEEVDDGVDNDCDGSVDECVGVPGEAVHFNIEQINGDPFYDGFFAPGASSVDVKIRVSGDVNTSTVFTVRSEGFDPVHEITAHPVLVDPPGPIQPRYYLELYGSNGQAVALNDGIMVNPITVETVNDYPTTYRTRFVVLNTDHVVWNETLTGLLSGVVLPGGFDRVQDSLDEQSGVAQTTNVDKKITAFSSLGLSYAVTSQNYYQYYIDDITWTIEHASLTALDDAPPTSELNTLEGSQQIEGHFELRVDLEEILFYVKGYEYQCDDWTCDVDTETPQHRIDTHPYVATVTHPTLILRFVLMAPTEGTRGGDLAEMALDMVGLEDDDAHTLPAREGEVASVVYDVDFTLRNGSNTTINPQDIDDFDAYVEVVDSTDHYDEASAALLESAFEDITYFVGHYTWDDSTDGLISALRNEDVGVCVDIYDVQFCFKGESILEGIEKAFHEALPPAAQISAVDFDGSGADTELDLIQHEENAVEYAINAKFYHQSEDPAAQVAIPYACAQDPSHLRIALTDLGIPSDDHLNVGISTRITTLGENGDQPGFVQGGATGMNMITSPSSALAGVSLSDTSLNQLLYWLGEHDLFNYPCDDSQAELTLGPCTFTINTPIVPWVDLSAATVGGEGEVELPLKVYNLSVRQVCTDPESGLVLLDEEVYVDGDLIVEVAPPTSTELDSREGYIGCDTNDALFLARVSARVDNVAVLPQSVNGCVAPLQQDPQEVYDAALTALMADLLRALACEQGGDKYLAPLGQGSWDDQAEFCESDALPLDYLAYYAVSICSEIGDNLPGSYLLSSWLEGQSQLDITAAVGPGSFTCSAQPIPGVDKCVDPTPEPTPSTEPCADRGGQVTCWDESISSCLERSCCECVEGGTDCSAPVDSCN